MKRSRLLLLVVALSLGYAASQSKDNQAEVALQAAIKREVVDGDLKGAIEQYRKLAQGRDQAVAARALVRMGQCYERLGDADARKAYERVIREFAGQKEAVATARARLNALGALASEGTGVVITQLPFGLDNDVGRVSRDGRFYVFADWDTTSDVTVRDLATGKQRRLTNRPEKSQEFADGVVWSEDGKQILYTWGGTGRGEELRTIQADGTGMKTVFRREGWGFNIVAWSPDGRKAAVHFRQGGSIREFGIADLTTGDWKPVKARWIGGQFSPDGRWIAYTTEAQDRLFGVETDLHLANADGEGETVVSSAPGFDGFPEWSADGKRLLFVSERTGDRSLWSVAVSNGKVQGEPELVHSGIDGYVVGLSRDGSLFFTRAHAQKDIYEATFDPSAQRVTGERKVLVSESLGRNRMPSISHDGEWLAFHRRAGEGWEDHQVVLRSLRTGQEKVLPVQVKDWSWAPVWLSDGKTLALNVYSAGHTFSLVNVETGRVQEIGPSGVSGWRAFAADGTAFFYTRRDEDTAATRLLRREVATGAETLLFSRKGRVATLAASPDGKWLAFRYSPDDWATNSSLYVVPCGGGEARELVPSARIRLAPANRDLAWAPASDRLYFLAAASAKDKPQVWTVPLAGGEPQPTGLEISQVTLSFTPDSRRVIFDVTKSQGNQLWVLRNLPGL